MRRRWEASEDWWRRHTSADLVYRLRLRLGSPQLVDRVWAKAAQGRQVDAGAILYGGAYVERVGPRDLEVGSGGEDALDSLAYGINDLVIDPLHELDPGEEAVVVREVRELVHNEDEG